MWKKTGLSLVLFLVLCGCCVVLFSASYRYFYRAAYPVEYASIVAEQSRANGLDEALVYAVIRTESGFNPQAQSSVNARGLMQITEDTFRWTQYRLGGQETLEFDDLYDSEQNIRYGCALLRLLMEKFGTVENALCAYHAGWGSAKQWLNDPAYSSDGVNIDHIPFADTAYYVEKVMQTKETYRTLYSL